MRDTCYSLASCEEVEEECDITACSSGHKVTSDNVRNYNYNSFKLLDINISVANRKLDIAKHQDHHHTGNNIMGKCHFYYALS